MFRVGDKVCPYDNMGITGTVVGMYEQKSEQWMTSGAMMPLWIIVVELDADQDVVEFRADKIRKVD